jgi:hypothetical protein
VRNTPPEFGPNRLISVLSKHNSLQINAFIFSKNLHNPEVTSSNLVLATLDKPSEMMAFSLSISGLGWLQLFLYLFYENLVVCNLSVFISGSTSM